MKLQTWPLVLEAAGVAPNDSMRTSPTRIYKSPTPPHNPLIAWAASPEPGMGRQRNGHRRRKPINGDCRPVEPSQFSKSEMCFSLLQADKIENTSKVIPTSVTSIQLMSTLRSILEELFSTGVIAQRQRSNVSSIDAFGRGPLRVPSQSPAMAILPNVAEFHTTSQRLGFQNPRRIL
jgi:hypothetical protein